VTLSNRSSMQDSRILTCCLDRVIVGAWMVRLTKDGFRHLPSTAWATINERVLLGSFPARNRLVGYEAPW